jgi:hypothetical protein
MCWRDVSWTRASSRISTGPTSPSMPVPSAKFEPSIPASCTYDSMQKSLGKAKKIEANSLSLFHTHTHKEKLYAQSISPLLSWTLAHTCSQSSALCGRGGFTSTCAQLCDDCAKAVASGVAMCGSPPSASVLSHSQSEMAKPRTRSM